VNINTLELRNYLLKPNMLEHFIDYFEEHFIFSQQDAGIHALGQFRIIGEPNRLVWLRGFSDMQTRFEALQKFYGGPVWEKYGPMANEMMLEWHNVHLLRPLSEIDTLMCGSNAGIVAAKLDAGTISPDTGVIVIDFYRAIPGKRDGMIGSFKKHVAHKYDGAASQLRGYFVAEMSENKFTRLPVIQNEDDFVVITAYDSEESCRELHGKTEQYASEMMGEYLSAAPECVVLSPTLRSPLRFFHLNP
jgi:hypothetical protein